MFDVSIIIPTYNGQRFLAAAFRSIWDQSILPDEILVVDDHSRDETLALANSLARQSPVPTRVIQLPVNSGGPARPINTGIREAKGHFVTVLDQDDRLLPDRVACDKQLLENNPAYNLVFGLAGTDRDDASTHQSAEIISLLNQFSTPISGDAVFRQLPSDAAVKLLLLHANFLYGFPAFTFRRDPELFAVDESFRIAGDYDLLIRLAAIGPLAFRPERGYVRVEHDSNATCNHLLTNLELQRIRVSYIQRLFPSKSDRQQFEAVKQWMQTFAFFAREAGMPAIAARLYWDMLKTWGLDCDTLSSLLKTFPADLLRRIRRRPAAGNGWTSTTFASKTKVVEAGR